jgi:hypothetical protein
MTKRQYKCWKVNEQRLVRNQLKRYRVTMPADTVVSYREGVMRKGLVKERTASDLDRLGKVLKEAQWGYPLEWREAMRFVIEYISRTDGLMVIGNQQADRCHWRQGMVDALERQLRMPAGLVEGGGVDLPDDEREELEGNEGDGQQWAKAVAMRENPYDRQLKDHVDQWGFWMNYTEEDRKAITVWKTGLWMKKRAARPSLTPWDRQAYKEEDAVRRRKYNTRRRMATEDVSMTLQRDDLDRDHVHEAMTPGVVWPIVSYEQVSEAEAKGRTSRVHDQMANPGDRVKSTIDLPPVATETWYDTIRRVHTRVGRRSAQPFYRARMNKVEYKAIRRRLNVKGKVRHVKVWTIQLSWRNMLSDRHRAMRALRGMGRTTRSVC